jgi:hypothetical protein
MRRFGLSATTEASPDQPRQLFCPRPKHVASYLDFTANYSGVCSLNCASGSKFLYKAHKVCLVFARYTHSAIKFSRNDGKAHYPRYLYGPDLETAGARLRSQTDIDIGIERGSEQRAIHLCMETRNDLDLLEAANPLSRRIWAQMNPLA